MFFRKNTSGFGAIDKILDDIYRILSLVNTGTTATRSRLFYGIPEYLNHELVPVPATGYRTAYFIHDDYTFLYFWDGTIRNSIALNEAFTI